ncbi:unnamed protein product [Durusdinium trenchii]|uniref:Uncharacterized protein n=1 Tax=Durusdinium trenchii TaxID=1381693 RepID=A0ABP0J1L8_9DINO
MQAMRKPLRARARVPTAAAARGGIRVRGLSTCRAAPGIDYRKLAVEVIRDSTEDERQWMTLMNTPSVASYARKAVIAKAKRDPNFAKQIALAAVTGALATPKLSTTSLPAELRASSALPTCPPALAEPRTPSIFDEEESDSPPRKVRRRLTYKQGYDAKSALIGESALGCLSFDLAAHLLSFVDLITKISALNCSSGLREVLQHRSAWDPLRISKPIGRGLLRRLKQKDPLGYFTEERVRAKRSFPRGFFDISQLEIVLMDPERVEMPQSDTEDEAPKPLLLTLIPDPLDEMLKRLKHYFTKVCDLTIRNIEDYRMDYRFVELRCSELEHFPKIELRHVDSTYHLHASRHHQPPEVDLARARAMNVARIPTGVEILNTSLTEREALFLQEHLSAFKNGTDFCLSHSIYRYVPSHTVRKKYKTVVEHLRRRFPACFGDREECQSTPLR